MNSRQRIRSDYYKILGILEFSDKETIKKAFRELAMKWHPDRHTDPDAKKKAEEIFKLVAEAYDILSKYKEQYDEILKRSRIPQVRIVVSKTWWTGTTGDTTAGGSWYNYEW